MPIWSQELMECPEIKIQNEMKKHKSLFLNKISTPEA
jgi:hypothetical protein